jgi:lipid-binding SYLF domain-containing protein
MHTPRLLPALIVCLLFLFGSACASIPVEERAQKRHNINRAAQETIDNLVEREPELKDKVDASVGYFVAEISAATAALVGGGSGIGVLYDREDSTRTYMNVRRYDLGLGLGVRRFRMLILFNDREGLEDFRRARCLNQCRIA